MSDGQPLFECVLCGQRFSEHDVYRRRYFPSTQVCRRCYKKGQESPHVVWCFGKPQVIGPAGKVLDYGYDSSSPECNEYCPDRFLCAQFISNSGQGGDMTTEIVCPFKQRDSLLAKAWMKCAIGQGCKVDKLRAWIERQGGRPTALLHTLRSGQEGEAVWGVESDGSFIRVFYTPQNQPTRQGPGYAQYKGARLPFRSPNSIGCQAFAKCMDGIMIDELMQWVRRRGGDPHRVLRLMRSGNLYGRRWRVDEENGFLKIDYRSEQS